MQPPSRPEGPSHQNNPAGRSAENAPREVSSLPEADQAGPSADNARGDAPTRRRTGPAEPDIRVSDRDRDAVAHQLQEAFAEGRLDDDEFDQRMRAAPTARVGADLAVLTRDLPETGGPTTRPAPQPGPGRQPGRFAIAYKGPIRRGGRWRVPERFSAVVYKGSGHIDLRVAELTSPVTTLVAVAYKSRIDVLVPVGARVDLEGFGVSKAWSAEEELESRLPADAPVLHVRGVGYKGSIEVSTKPKDSGGSGPRSLPG
jgi:Domain of unknown function (DUF1707)